MWKKSHASPCFVTQIALSSTCVSWCVMAQDDPSNWKKYTCKSLHFICMPLSFADRVSSGCIWIKVSEMKRRTQNNPPTLPLATDLKWEKETDDSHRRPTLQMNAHSQVRILLYLMLQPFRCQQISLNFLLYFPLRDVFQTSKRHAKD